MSEPALRLEGIARTYMAGETPLEVLREIDLDVMPGEIVGLIGPSGSGKSSLLHAAGLLERPSAGRISIQGRDCSDLGDDQRTRLRRTLIGFVYQFHHLLPEFTALENVAMPARIAGEFEKAARAHARDLLTGLGLADRLQHQPAQLSGGEQQRVAIARALANRPHLLLADEPTGNLDPATAEAVFAAMNMLVREHGVAALMATHNLQLATYMDRVYELRAGRLVRSR